jgi:uncharacterized Zn-finger protein
MGALVKHMKSVYEEIRDFQCPICQIKLSAKDSLDRHLRIVHENMKPFECIIVFKESLYIIVRNKKKNFRKNAQKI